MTDKPAEPASTAKIARDAAVHELVSFGVYVALVAGLAVAMAKRDALARARARASAVLFPPHASSHDVEVASLRAELSVIEHTADWGRP